MIFRRPAVARSEPRAPMTEAELLLEHANIMRKLASDMASQHLTLMLVGDGSPMNNLVRDTFGANRRSMEEAADHLHRLARESRLRPPGLTLWQSALRLGLAIAVGITIAPLTLMALFWAIDQVAPVVVSLAESLTSQTGTTFHGVRGDQRETLRAPDLTNESSDGVKRLQVQELRAHSKAGYLR